jgi:hypothetical protein
MKRPYIPKRNNKKHIVIIVCYYMLEVITTQVLSIRLLNKVIKVYNKISKLHVV